MGKKKIKTFTVDEEVYNAVVAMFRESGAEVSVSHFLDKCLKELLDYLSVIERQRKKSPEKYTAPLSYIIESAAKSPMIAIMEYDSTPGDPYVPGEFEADEYQMKYEAEKKSIPLRFYSWMFTGKMKLSPDRKYLVNVKTGKKYVPDEDGMMLRDAPDEEGGK